MKGFTIIEILVAVAIMVLISGLSITSFSVFSKRQALDAAATALVSGLRDARAQTLASVGGAQYGVLISSDRFIFFQGAVYNAAATSNQPFIFSSNVSASSSLGSIVFQRLTGNSTASGTISVYLKSDLTAKRTISIGNSGLVSVN